ncbi:MAG: hypothetical protein JW751_27465 [Polyangiaceae bacterium]|nr:hypothetical protein [Polyangiaceae bacterium]
MSLAARLEQLEPRERRLLNLLVILFVLIIVIALPLGLRAALLTGSERNQRLAEAIDAIRDQRAALVQRAASAGEVASRYARPAPPLAELLETLAKKQELAIPESQDRPVIPHGKQYEERSNRIVLRKVGLLDLAKFMEGIAQSGHPVKVSDINIKKRAPDAYDVTMVVSAFDRTQKEKEKAEDSEKVDKEDQEENTEETPSDEADREQGDGEPDPEAP